MRIKNRLSFGWACVVGLFLTHYSSAQELLIPSVNHWNLSQELLMDPELSEALEVSPQQAKQIRQMRARNDLAALFSRKMNEIRINGQTANPRDQAWASLDSVIRAELLTILEDEQLSMLRRLVLRARFQDGVAPFLNRDVLNGLKLTKQDASTLTDKAGRAKLAYEQQIAKWKRDVALKVFQQLPQEARSLFVQYLGNDLQSGVVVVDEVKGDAIPFPAVCSSVSAARSIIRSRDMQKHAKITKNQLASLDELSRGFSYSAILRSGGDLAAQAKAIEYAAYRQYQAILEPSQRLAVSRQIAFNEFVRDFSRPLSRPALISYLRLDSKEALDLASVVDKEANALRNRKAQADQQAFMSLAGELPEEPQEKLVTFFRDVWQIR